MRIKSSNTILGLKQKKSTIDRLEKMASSQNPKAFKALATLVSNQNNAAFNAIERLAANNNPWAQQFLQNTLQSQEPRDVSLVKTKGGRIYYALKQFKDAVRWFNHAKDNTTPQAPEASYYLSQMHALGRGCAKSSRENSLKFLVDSASTGYAPAMYKLAFYYANGFIGDKGSDEKQYISYLTKAAKAGHKQAQYELGKCYSSGIHGVVQNFKQAESWYTEAEKQGLILAGEEKKKMLNERESLLTYFVQEIVNKQDIRLMKDLVDNVYKKGDDLSFLIKACKKLKLFDASKISENLGIKKSLAEAILKNEKKYCEQFENAEDPEEARKGQKSPMDKLFEAFNLIDLKDVQEARAPYEIGKDLMDKKFGAWDEASLLKTKLGDFEFKDHSNYVFCYLFGFCSLYWSKDERQQRNQEEISYHQIMLGIKHILQD